MSFDDGIVLITGASSGIGREIAKQLANRAATIIVVARRNNLLQELKQELLGMNPGLDVLIFPCDLSVLEEVENMSEKVLEQYGSVDFLVNNAGLGDIGIFSESSWEKNKQLIDVNIVALTFLCRRFLPPMLSKGKGTILNVSSGFGLLWMPFFSSYVASKHYVSALTECLRAECVGTGVLISQLCPGPVETEFEEKAENPMPLKATSFVSLSAEKCAKIAIAGVKRKKAIIQPGFIGSASIWAGRLSPRWASRLFYSLFIRQLRPKMRRDK
jgi:uncharacterized protein